MKNLSFLLSILFISACTNAAEDAVSAAKVECEFHFASTHCKAADYIFDITTEKVATDELKFKSLLVQYNEQTYVLTFSDGISLIDGDIGVIYIEDINFDIV